MRLLVPTAALLLTLTACATATSGVALSPVGQPAGSAPSAQPSTVPPAQPRGAQLLGVLVGNRGARVPALNVVTNKDLPQCDLIIGISDTVLLEVSANYFGKRPTACNAAEAFAEAAVKSLKGAQ